MRISSIIIRE